MNFNASFFKFFFKYSMQVPAKDDNRNSKTCSRHGKYKGQVKGNIFNVCSLFPSHEQMPFSKIDTPLPTQAVCLRHDKVKALELHCSREKAVLLDGNSVFSYIFITFKILQIKSQLIILLVPQGRERVVIKGEKMPIS